MNRTFILIGSTAYASFVNALFQLFIPYLFLRLFDASTTAAWMVAISAFTIISTLDVGLLQLVQYKLQRLGSKNIRNKNFARRYIEHLNFYIVISTLNISVLITLVSIIWFPDFLVLSTCIIIGYVLRYMFVIFRSRNSMATGNAISSLPMLILMSSTLIYEYNNLNQIMLCYLLAHLATLTCGFIIIYRLGYPFTFKISSSKIYSTFHAAGKYWLLNFTQILNQFLPVIIIGRVFTPSELVLFSTTRTMLSIPLSLALIINNAMQPLVTELKTQSTLIIRSKINRARKIFYPSIAVITMIFLPFSEKVYGLWLANSAVFSLTLVLVISLRVFLQIIVYTEQNINVGLGTPLHSIIYEINLLLGLVVGFISNFYFGLSLEVFILLFLVAPILITLALTLRGKN